MDRRGFIVSTATAAVAAAIPAGIAAMPKPKPKAIAWTMTIRATRLADGTTKFERIGDPVPVAWDDALEIPDAL